MHCIIGVIHSDPELNIDDYFYRFCYENVELFERYEYLSTAEVIETVQKELEKFNNPENIEDYQKYYAESLLKAETMKEKIEAYADWDGWQVDGDLSLYRECNPYGECDWWQIGGRWDGALVDFDGNGRNMLRIQDINLDNDNTLVSLYGVVNEYLGDDYIEYLGDDDNLETVLKEPLKYCQTNEVDLYMTLVDMHQ